jgi:AcrR family transcriptional regulator
MTRNDIIKAAFKVWGRDYYRTTSLTDVARELGVSKAALYRHFLDKEALLDAMYAAFFDDYVSSIKDDYEKALSAENRRECHRIMFRAITGYFLRNKDAFLFSLIQVYGNHEVAAMNKILLEKGIDMKKILSAGKAEGYPSSFQFINVTLVFWVACFHRFVYKGCGVPPDDLVQKTLVSVENWIRSGLGIGAGNIEALDYGALEKRTAETIYEDTEDNELLRAVAGAVAAAGPWNASMEMVAKRSGLSKSGLYAHFKNKQDMLGRLFVTEFDHIAGYAGAQAKSSAVPEEQLYLVIFSIAQYLRSRPEILVALDWIKTRRFELEVEVPVRIYESITALPLRIFENHKDEKEYIAQWILFLIINIMMWSGDINGVPNESFRLLFRYISCGLEGLTVEAV